jgi:hypothetical protein
MFEAFGVDAKGDEQLLQEIGRVRTLFSQRCKFGRLELEIVGHSCNVFGAAIHQLFANAARPTVFRHPLRDGAQYCAQALIVRVWGLRLVHDLFPFLRMETAFRRHALICVKHDCPAIPW